MGLVTILPVTVLGNLAIGECSVKFEPSVCTWDFWCGLRISDELASRSLLEMSLLGEVHRRHHEHSPFSQEPWDIISTMETKDLSLTITVSCGCETDND